MGLVGGKVERGEKLLVLVVQVATLPENREGSRCYNLHFEAKRSKRRG